MIAISLLIACVSFELGVLYHRFVVNPNKVMNVQMCPGVEQQLEDAASAGYVYPIIYDVTVERRRELMANRGLDSDE